ncbi:helix-turn-helix domain-containing protein [Clostridium perfringens]|uniref:helix-turn-helix domain-containing protein n=1 Tax=Clostridium perfringens TaxID=1502 RepID=UPI0028CC52CD|nr:helix-turn-helix domain-containing protein [Clostridium perfringens]MDM0881676.1 helix-turn-helix domain-containing protein [Clostridium perfringens]MDT7983948.1 helix-turn-helix domain-containing protein [Clostridium perfringens]MDT8039464.1 helix-turn-helix domain-containing protein [Clostridium perfringens]
MDEIRYEGKSILSKGYGIIPKLIMQSDISIEAKAIYAYMCSFAGNGQSAFPGVDKIIYELKITRRRFYKYRKELEDHGMIKVQKTRNGNRNSRNIYIIAQTIPDKCHFDTYQNEQYQNEQYQNDYTNNNILTSNKLNNNNVNNNNREVVVDKEVKKILKGFTTKEISSVIKFCEENKVHVDVVEEKLKILKSMKKVNNKVGALISAIKNDWKESSGIDNSKNPKEANFTQREYDYDDLEKGLLGWYE